MLKKALSETHRFRRGSTTQVRAMEPPKLAGVADEVLKRHAQAGIAPIPPDLDRIAERLRATAHEANGSEFKRRDLRYAPHCLWSGSAPISEEDQSAASAIVAAIADKGRRSLIKTLAASYLRNFHDELALAKRVGETLTELAPKGGGWVETLSDDYGAFDYTEGVDNIAAHCFSHDEPPDELLARYGLRGDLLTHGLSERAAIRCLSWMSERLGASPTRNWVEKIAHWTYRDGEERFNEARYAMVRALIGPFRRSPPGGGVKQLILDWVLGRLKDPRLAPENWEQVREERDIVKGWLTEQSIQQFLDVVDRTAQPSHWRYRRAFWEAFYRQGLITEARAAFASAGQSEARKAFGRNASFAELRATSKPVEHGHAVLIMRIGQFVLCDWSHNGRCIIWMSTDKQAPGLDRSRYLSGDLAPPRAPEGGLDVRHDGSKNYNWQRQINRFIRQHVGSAVSDSAFQVTHR
jgi:hypothetical protein